MQDSEFQINFKGFIIVCGNTINLTQLGVDGAGKTSVAALINKTQNDFYAFERSTKPENPQLLEIKQLIKPSHIDL